jgi:hypothetical protein
MERLEGDASLKIPVKSPGIDPGTVRLVVQRLNRYATPGTLKELTLLHKNNTKFFYDFKETGQLDLCERNVYVKEDYAEKLVTFTGQRSETVRHRKQRGKTGAVLFEMKARKWKMFHKVETHDLPFHLMSHRDEGDRFSELLVLSTEKYGVTSHHT